MPDLHRNYQKLKRTRLKALKAGTGQNMSIRGKAHSKHIAHNTARKKKKKKVFDPLEEKGK